MNNVLEILTFEQGLVMGSHASKGPLLGSSEFIESLLAQAGESYEKRILAKVEGLDLHDVVYSSVDHFGIERGVIRSPAKERTVAWGRAIVCFLAIDRLGIKGADIASKMNVTPSGVSKLSERGRKAPLVEEMESRLFDGWHT